MASEKNKGANPIDAMEDQGVFKIIEELVKKKIFELEKLKKKIFELEKLKKKIFELEKQDIPAGVLSNAPTSGIRLEIVVKNGTELQNVHRTHRLNSYPVVFIRDIDGEIYGSKKQKPVDDRKGANPVWDACAEFIIDIYEASLKEHALFVRVESKRKIRPGSKFVGECSVSIEDLLNDYAVDKKSFTRSVMNKKGEAHGTVTFECKIGRTPDPLPAASLSQPADPPLPQPANGRRNSNGRPFLRAFAGDVLGDFFTTVAETISDEVLNG